MWRWITWRRWYSLSGRIRPDGDDSEIRVWFPFTLLFRVSFLMFAVPTLIVFALIGVGFSEWLFIAMVAVVNLVAMARARDALRKSFEAAIETGPAPAWRYHLDDRRQS